MKGIGDNVHLPARIVSTRKEAMPYILYCEVTGGSVTGQILYATNTWGRLTLFEGEEQ